MYLAKLKFPSYETMSKSKFKLCLCLIYIFLTACVFQPKYIEFPDSPPPPREIKNIRVALVLGGGARGVAHLGVIRVLEKYGIPLISL